MKEAGDTFGVSHVAMIKRDLWRNFTELYLCRDFGHMSCLAMNEMGGMKKAGWHEKAGDTFGFSNVAMITTSGGILRNFTCAGTLATCRAWP
jgi:hypothetical protein